MHIYKKNNNNLKNKKINPGILLIDIGNVQMKIDFKSENRLFEPSPRYKCIYLGERSGVLPQTSPLLETRK